MADLSVSKFYNFFPNQLNFSQLLCLKARAGKIVPILFLVSFLSSVSLLHAEEDLTFVFQGRILDENSSPATDVYLINYRTLKFCRTDIDGRFFTKVLPSDSFMIYHVSYESLIIKPIKSDTLTSIYVPFKVYELFESNVSVVMKKTSVYEEILLANFDKNWDRMMGHMQKELSYAPIQKKVEHPSDSSLMPGNSPFASTVSLAPRSSSGVGLSVDGVYEGVKKLTSKFKR